MALPKIPTTLKRGVGRKILSFFLLAALLPVAFTAGLAFFEIQQSTGEEIKRTLRANAKDYGLDLLGRLQRTSLAADDVQRMVERDGISGLLKHDYLLAEFDGAWYRDAVGSVRSVGKQFEREFGLAELAALESESPSARLHISRDDNGGVITLFRSIGDRTAATGTLILQVESAVIWGDAEEYPYRTDYCVLSTSGALYHCSTETSPDIHQLLLEHARNNGKGVAEWQQSGETYVGAIWQLFLAGDFGIPSVDIIALQPEFVALQSGADVSRVFMPALLLVVVLVAVLSFAAIGESLNPLQKLTMAVRQFTAGNLDARLRIRSNDEFEWLGDAFNQMAIKLGRQISTLEAMSEIDRQILSGAKFEQVSERVVSHLTEITGYEAAAVIAHDADTPNWAKMISTSAGEVVHERIPLPKEMGHHWCQPRQVSLDEANDMIAPYRARFRSYGVKFVALIPVVLKDDLKGILLLGSASRLNLEQDSLLRCVDLAGRFAVALASVEREDALYRQAHFDELTGLPNRQLLKDRLEQQIVRARRENFSGALLFLDLDRFKEINDVYGHSVGDIVLTQAAERIEREVRDSDTVARLGGDEFVVVLPRIPSDNLIHVTATRLLAPLDRLFLGSWQRSLCRCQYRHCDFSG